MKPSSDREAHCGRRNFISGETHIRLHAAADVDSTRHMTGRIIKIRQTDRSYRYHTAAVLLRFLTNHVLYCPHGIRGDLLAYDDHT